MFGSTMKYGELFLEADAVRLDKHGDVIDVVADLSVDASDMLDSFLGVTREEEYEPKRSELVVDTFDEKGKHATLTGVAVMYNRERNANNLPPVEGSRLSDCKGKGRYWFRLIGSAQICIAEAK